MELFLGALVAFLVEVLVLAALVAPRRTRRMLRRPLRAAGAALQGASKHPHRAQPAGR